MAEIKWSKKAINDLQAIYDFISLDSGSYADKYINRIIHKIEQLQTYPNLGRVVPEKNDNSIRELIVGSHRIFYKVDSTSVKVIRLHHSAQKIN